MRGGFGGAWPWVAWFLPPLLFAVKFFSGTGGWEMLMLLFALPVVLPVMGLLYMLPRFVLRKRGHGFVPLTVAVLMVASWWGLVASVLAWRGVGDSGSVDSMLAELFWGFSQRAEAVTALIGALVAVGAWFAAAVCAFAMEPASRRGEPGGPVDPAVQGVQDRALRRARLWWIALPAVPLALAVAVSGIEVVAMVGPRDTGGEREIDAAWRSPAETLRVMEERWDETQGVLVPVREALTREGWEPDTVGGAYTERATVRRHASYRLIAGWLWSPGRTLGELEPVLRGIAEGPGWAPATFDDEWDDLCRWAETDGYLCFAVQNEAGYTLTLRAFVQEFEDAPHAEGGGPAEGEGAEGWRDPASTLVEVRLDGPDYWLGESPDWWRMEGQSTVADPWQRTYAFDEWPELRAVMRHR